MSLHYCGSVRHDGQVGSLLRRVVFAVASAGVLAAALSLADAQQTHAADLPLIFPGDEQPATKVPWGIHLLDAPKGYTGDFGLRFWFGSGKTAKNLYDVPPSTALVSRLTYYNMPIFTTEGFARFDFNNGWFFKGNIGGGGFLSGHLRDEDFGLTPPLQPYSATLSDQKHGSALYSTVDFGAKLFRGPDFHVGAFVGYNFLRETVSAYGCSQIAVNPLLCGDFPVPNSIRAITQVNNWHSLRVGVDAGFEVDRFRVSAEAALLPYVRLNGSDAHWLRIDPNTVDAFTGPVPEDGTGWGYQLEGFASYRLTDWLSVGAGARWWHMQTKGYTHFEGHVVGDLAFPQPVNWKADNFGAFVQTSVRFGPYPLISGY